jgi:hypothetical protein
MPVNLPWAILVRVCQPSDWPHAQGPSCACANTKDNATPTSSCRLAVLVGPSASQTSCL